MLCQPVRELFVFRPISYIHRLKEPDFRSKIKHIGETLMKIFERFQRLLLNALSSKIARITIDFIVIVLIGLLVFRNFLFSCYWPAGGDILGWISRVYLFGHDLRWTYTWRPHSFGFPENIHLIDFFCMLLYNLLKDPIF